MEKHEKHRSRQPVSRPTFERGTSRSVVIFIVFMNSSEQQKYAVGMSAFVLSRCTNLSGPFFFTDSNNILHWRWLHKALS